MKIVATFLVLLGTVAFGMGTALAQEATPAAEDVEWLAVIHFESAAVSLDPGMASEATVVLHGVGESVVEFTERPARSTRVRSTEDFVVSMADQQADPVNADLAATLSGKEDSVQLVVEILSISYDPEEALMTMQVVVLNGYLNGAPLADERVVASGLGSGFVFVDGM